MTEEYVLTNKWHQARERLSRLEGVKDPDTTEYFERISVSTGWRCLEVGGGGGSIAKWLCEIAGSTGHVIATDMDTRFLDVVDSPNLEVRTHNILTDDLEVSSYDLVHARAVL